MAPPTLARAAAAKYPEEILEVRCVGCRETLEVEPGLTEFVCPDCGTPQSLPPELMPPPRRRALPMPRGAADARGARLPCGACGELLSVPVGLSRCACPFCGAELAVDSARLRNYILSSAAAVVVVPLPAASVSPIVAAREIWQAHPNYATRAVLPRAEPNARLVPMGRTQMQRPNRPIHVHRNEQEYPDHMIDGEEIPVANETVTKNNLQRNRLSPGCHMSGNKERQDLPPNEVRNHVNDQHRSYTVQPKQPQLARVRRVIHLEEMQEGPLNHEVYREARHTELIYETAATHRNQRVGCSVGPQSLSAEDKHMETPGQIIQQVHQHPYHESHAKGKHVGCLDLNGVLHPPFNQANHGQEASTEMINEALARERSIRPTGCSVGPNSVSVEKRNLVKQKTQKQQSDVTHAEDAHQEHPDQAVQEPINYTTQKESMSSLHIKKTKQKKSQFVNYKTVAKKRHIEPVNHAIPQAEEQTSDSDSHEIQADFERPSKGNERHGNTSNLKEREQVMLNKLSDLKQKNVRTNEIQKEQIEVDVSKQTSGWTRKKKIRKGSMGPSNAGSLTKDSVPAVENEPVESDPDDLQDFGPNIQVPSVAPEDAPMEWGPFQRRSASPDCEVSVATTDTESVESEHDEVSVATEDSESVESEHDAVSPDQSMSESEPPDIDRIIADTFPSTPSAHKMPHEISDEPDDPDYEPDDPDSTASPSNTDMSDPEQFARNYCLLLPPEVRRVLAKKKAAGFGNLCGKVWTLPKGVRVPVWLNTLGLPIGENADTYKNFLGALARDATLAPLTYISWTKVPKENKSVMWHIVKLIFDVDPPCESSILRFIRNKRKVWKSQLKQQHYDSHVTDEERLADRDPRVPKDHWRGLVAYWNTEKFKAISAACKANRARSLQWIRQEESRAGDPAHEDPEGSGSDYASGSGAERRGRTRRHKPGPSPKDLQGRSASQAARAKRKAGDEASTLREESHSKNPQVLAFLKEARAKRRAEDEADALRKKVVVMEDSQKKLQEDLAKMTNAVSAMQKMMSAGGLPNGLMGGPMVPPKF
ncbi:unnamed protein product [Alopecurus aequalis]